MRDNLEFEPVRRIHAPNPEYIAPRLQVIDPITLAGLPVPERKWIVKDWIPDGTVTQLSGDGGVGKSLLALQLLVCVAAGKDWLGLPTKPCRALGIFCEDDADELHRRLIDVCEHYQVSLADLENLKLVSRVGEENSLMTFDRQTGAREETEFFYQVHREASDFGAQVVTLDSLHDLFTGNENARPEARAFIQKLTQLARDIDGTVLLTAHPSVAGRSTGSGESGSTAWNNAVRSRLYITRPSGANGDDQDPASRDVRELQRKKANYASVGDSLILNWKDGIFVRDDVPGGMFAAIRRQSAEQAFLACLDRITEQGRPVNTARNFPDRYAPRVFAAMPEADGHLQTELAQAMTSLFNTGIIVMTTTKGTNRHPQQTIARASK